MTLRTAFLFFYFKSYYSRTLVSRLIASINPYSILIDQKNVFKTEKYDKAKFIKLFCIFFFFIYIYIFRC